jgi:hypothetical protein
MLRSLRNAWCQWTTAFAAAAVLLTTPAAAAVAPRVGGAPPPSRASADLGWDPTWMLVLGMSREILPSHAGIDVSADVQARLPFLLLPNGEISAGATLYSTPGGVLGATLGVHPDLRLARDSTGTWERRLPWSF